MIHEDEREQMTSYCSSEMHDGKMLIRVYYDDANNAEEILLYSDDAMYKAKAKGKNNFHFYS